MVFAEYRQVGERLIPLRVRIHKLQDLRVSLTNG